MTAALQTSAARSLVLRPVRREDAAILFEWANLPANIAVSIRRRGAVGWDEHCAWLEGRLADPETAFWILEHEGTAAGYLRLQGGADGPEVSIYVGPAARRCGMGLAMLARARREQATRWPDRPLLARVRPDNAPARAIFEAAGYRPAETRPDHLLYRDGYAQRRTTPCPAAAAAVVYADSRLALSLAWEDGLARHLAVRSNAPALIADPEIRASRADEGLTPDHIRALVAALGGAADEVRAEIAGSDLPGAAEAAIAVYSVLVGELQNHVCTAAMLRPVDLVGSACIVAIRHADPDLRRRFRFTLADVLAECDGPPAIEIDGARLPPVEQPTPPHPDLAERLAHATIESLAYRLGRALWDRAPFGSPRPGIAIYRENELLKETAAHLLMRGYCVRSLALAADLRDEEACPLGIAPRAAKALQHHLGAVLPPGVAAALGRIGSRLAEARLRDFVARRTAWQHQLKTMKGPPRAVLSNRLHSAEYWALYSALTEAGIPLVAFQHGVTPEFALDRTDKHHGHENTGADLSLVFNPAMVELSRANPLARGPAVAVGMPKDYRRLRRRRSTRLETPVWYVRTALYQSNLGRMHRGLSDPGMYARERLLVEEVFARIPHRVAYKPYPAIRYLDPDPVETLVRSFPNITLYEGRLDLRYVVAGARLLVTAGATSTLSWCLMATRPLVFLDSADFVPLQPEVRKGLEGAAFVVDMAADGAAERLRLLLSRPLPEIEAGWRDKAAARRDFIARYVDSGQARPGAFAADQVESLLQERGAGGRR